MNDKIIINTIEKIHFTIVSFLASILFILFTLFVLFQNGVYIEDISLPNLKIKQLYIKYNEKLNITLDELVIHKQKSNLDTKFDYFVVDEIFKTMILFDNWFEKIAIKKISYNDISGSFKYIDGKNGFLKASSSAFNIKSFIFFESNMLNLKIDEFKDLKRDVKIDGNIIVNSEKLEIYNALNIDINNEVKLKLHAILNPKTLYYTIKSTNKIKNIKHTVELFDLDEEVVYWVSDAIKMSDAKIDSINGWADFDNLDSAYKNLNAKLLVNNLDYTYDSKLEAIHSKKTLISFKDGVLYIRPLKAKTYDFNLGKSWLKIDFNKKEELLSLYLLFNGFVNQDLLNLLSHYEIDLPFKQNSGEVKTDLTLEIGLRDIDIEAKGNFYTKKANFTYLGLDIDIFDANINLDNYDVSIKKMLSKYKDIATAIVDVDFDAKNTQGEIVFDVKDVNFKDLGLSLKKSKDENVAIYKISPKQDILSLNKTTWSFDKKDINIDTLDVNFDIEKLDAKIPTTLVDIPNIAKAYVSGDVSFKTMKLDLDIDLLKFSLNQIELNQSHAPIDFIYNKKITIKSDEPIRLNVNSQDFTLDNTLVDIENENIKVKYSALKIDDLLNTMFNADYNYKTKVGTINLQNTEFKNKHIGDIFSDEETLKIDVDAKKLHEIKMSLKKLNMDYIIKQNEWKLKFNSLGSIVRRSKILKDYNVKNGNAIIYKNNHEKDIKFLVNTIYPYEILVTDNEPTNSYTVKGKIEDKTNDVSLNVNNKIDIKINKDIKVTTKNIGINLEAIFDFFEDKNSTSKTNSDKSTDIFLDAKDSYIYLGKTRHVISDSIKLQYFNDIVTAQLIHEKGQAGFKFEDNNFHLYGEDFNDEFMRNFFDRSDFKNGTLSFSIDGNTTEYSGVFHVKDTIIKDYKILNNVLAFVNTIPSLVTFSMPGYSSKGLKVKEGYVNFHYKDKVYDISDVKIDSKELKILGKGKASIANNTIDLKLNLKTDLGSSVSKIPVVGYILLGKDSVSTSLGLTGKLDNPKVETLIAQDIIVAPFNIIKRTLLLPFNIFNSDKKKED